MNTTISSEHERVNAHEFWSRFVQPRVAHIQRISPLNSTELVRDARQTLNDELAAMNIAMCTLRTRLNALSPTSSLPVAILAQIFKLVAADMALDISYSSRPSFGWIHTITHVCRHWRQAALSHRNLWSNIYDSSTPRWRKLMIARAKSAPLTINLNSYHPEENALLAEHVFHTRILRLAAPQAALKNTCDSFTSSADILEHLSLRVSDDAAINSAIVLPTDIFAGHAPLLHRVTLVGAFCSWSTPIFHNLTLLRVGLSERAAALSASQMARFDESDPKSQYDHLLDALTRMPRLQTLDLTYCIPSRPHRAAERLPIAFPCLEFLSLAGTLIACADVLRHITVPTSARITIKCVGDAQPIDGLVRFVDRHANRHDMPPLLTLVVSRHQIHTRPRSPEWLCIDLWQTCRLYDEENIPGDPTCHPTKDPLISIYFPPTPKSLDSLERLCRVLPLEDLRVVQVTEMDDEVAWTPEVWICMFGRCARIERVSVQGWNVVCFCKALLLPVDGPRGGSATRRVTSAKRLSWRRLESVEICGVDLLSDLAFASIPFIDSFRAWLSIRANLMGMGISDCTNSSGCDDPRQGRHSSEDKMIEGANGGGGSRRNVRSSQGTSQDVIAPCRGGVEPVDNRLKCLRISECSIKAKDVELLRVLVQDLVWDNSEGGHAGADETC